MSLALDGCGRLFPRFLPRPVWATEEGPDGGKHNGDDEVDGENRICDDALTCKPAADAFTFVVKVGKQYQRRDQQSWDHHPTPKGGVAHQLLQAEKIPRR